MKNMKKIIAGVVVAGLLGTAGVAYAAEAKTPAEIVSNLTGETVDRVVSQKSAGTTYGAQVQEAGKFEEFKAAMLEQRKAMLDELVKEGKLTQAEADERLKAMEENMANCDGTGSDRGTSRCGTGLGQGNGQKGGRGFGMRNGSGLGRGMGRNCNP